MADVKDLQRLVLDRLAALGKNGRSLSMREAAARANNKPSYETIRLIAAGEHSGRLEEDSVNGLALALDVKRSEILRALHRSQVQPLPPFRLPDRANRLGLRQRRAVLYVVEAMLDAAEQGARADAEAPAGPTSEGLEEAVARASQQLQKPRRGSGDGSRADERRANG